MRILVVGSGGREHALAWKLTASPHAEKVFVAPGNGGTLHNVPLDPLDFAALARFCKDERIDMIVVGPETPLAHGIADYFEGSPVAVFGPGRDGARLESSKIFAKRFMQRHGVATAPFWVVEPGEDPSSLIRDLDGDLVVKYDGLAAGKGVVVCSSVEEAERAAADLRLAFGPSAPFVIERRLQGLEVSIIGITDGETFLPLQPTRDYKRRDDGDRGPNTGGMGACTPAPFCTPQVQAQIDRCVVAPTLEGLRLDRVAYRGALYFGVMLTAEGPRLLEYNVRLGDPETEVVLPALESDLLDVCCRCLRGELGGVSLEFHPDSFLDVVLASDGYPGSYATGLAVRGLDALPPGALVFHAGTRRTADSIVTSGGRVLDVVGRGATLEEAVARTYGYVECITFDNRVFRGDIGRRALA